MSWWKQILAESKNTPGDLPASLGVDLSSLDQVTSVYPMRVNPYYMSLIRYKNDPIYRQCIPDIREITEQNGLEDPLNEEGRSPVFGLTHKYPDRVLLLVSSMCAMYCRFCNRKRKVGNPLMVTGDSVREGIAYIRAHEEIRDVLLSGGDPFLLEDKAIFDILTELRSIRHVEIIRIGTRTPCTLPQRITSDLAEMLKLFHPLYINTHFNHPSEITPEAQKACKMLADAGIPLGCQTVLLKGVNDSLEVMKSLMHKLVINRVRPYYIFQADMAKGTSHFWTPLERGIEIMRGLQGHTSGLCIPHFVIDLPGGGGKVPVIPDYITGSEKDALYIRNYKGDTYRYPLI